MDVRGNKIKLDDDTEISYDKCLIATGKALHFIMWPLASNGAEAN